MLKELGWELVAGAIGTTLLGGITGWLAKGWLTPSPPPPAFGELVEEFKKASVGFQYIANVAAENRKDFQELKGLVQESLKQQKGEATC
jgi:hypothetical protein